MLYGSFILSLSVERRGLVETAIVGEGTVHTVICRCSVHADLQRWLSRAPSELNAQKVTLAVKTRFVVPFVGIPIHIHNRNTISQVVLDEQFQGIKEERVVDRRVCMPENDNRIGVRKLRIKRHCPLDLVCQSTCPFNRAMHSTTDEIQPYEQSLFVKKCKVFFPIRLPNNAKGVLPVVFKCNERGIPKPPCSVYVGTVIPIVVCKKRTWRSLQIGLKHL